MDLNGGRAERFNPMKKLLDWILNRCIRINQREAKSPSDALTAN